MTNNATSQAAVSEAHAQCKALPRRIAFFALMLAVAPLPGCSVSMPIGSFFGEDDTPPTASINEKDTADTLRLEGKPGLVEGMDSEDTRRSQSALALALDPEGKGVPVNWDNPQTGSKGSFRSTGEFFLTGNQLCRNFAADIDKSGQASAYDGRACRAGPQNWVIIDAKPAAQR